MPTIDHSHEAKFCEGEFCRAVKVWREKCLELKQRLDIAEKAALACPRPMVWKDEPPKKQGWYWMMNWHEPEIVDVSYSESREGELRFLSNSRPCSSDVYEGYPQAKWAWPISEPVEQVDEA